MGAAMVLEGALARESFDAYVEQLLLPTLVPGQIVVCDRLPVHKSARARALIEGAGCALRLLPSYSPDFNPIELAFAKIKQTLRGAAERTFAGIVAATGHALSRHRYRCPGILRPLRLSSSRTSPMNAALGNRLCSN